MTYATIEDMVAATFEAISPTQFLSVSENAQKNVIIRQPGSHVGPWSAQKTPYLLEPQEILTSLDFTGMIFAGPARTGKSQLLLNWLAHTAIIDPTDMMIVHMAQHTAREWSKSDLEKMFRNSPEVKARLRPGRQNDNTFDKEFLSGMRLQITWPTANNLSGKTLRFNWVMDMDRMPDSIDGEGNVFDLTRTRARTFKRFGMTVAESSPGRLVDNPKWIAKTPHEAPPTKGILGLYNRGDRRRWYWRCPQCRQAFEPSFGLLDYPNSQDPMEAAEQVTLVCPHDGFPIEPAFKEELNLGGRWVKDGMIWRPESNDIVVRNGQVAARSDIASFWLKGPAAAFQEWSSLVLEYLRAEAAFESTGDEEPLLKTVTADQGEPYTMKSAMSERSPDDLMNKAEEWGSTQEQPTVPHDVRFLMATVDVQKRAFVVQVHGFAPGGDVFIIDGFKIRKSARLDEDLDPHPIDPAGFAEDWEQLVPHVIERTYPLADGSGRHMKIKLVGCDSGGREGVTHNAYEFWRKLKADGKGHHRRFCLVKGGTSEKDPRARIVWPDSNRQDRFANARGEIPVVLLNPWLLKDQVSNMMARRVGEGETEGGGGSLRYPKWMPDWFYTQMTTETRSTKGWENPGRRRNESFDLAYYAMGLALRPIDNVTHAPLITIRYNKIDWDAPPTWAAPWDENDLIVGAVVAAAQQAERKKKPSFADLAKELA